MYMLSFWGCAASWEALSCEFLISMCLALYTKWGFMLLFMSSTERGTRAIFMFFTAGDAIYSSLSVGFFSAFLPGLGFGTGSLGSSVLILEVSSSVLVGSSWYNFLPTGLTGEVPAGFTAFLLDDLSRVRVTFPTCYLVSSSSPLALCPMPGRSYLKMDIIFYYNRLQIFSTLPPHPLIPILLISRFLIFLGFSLFFQLKIISPYE